MSKTYDIMVAGHVCLDLESCFFHYTPIGVLFSQLLTLGMTTSWLNISALAMAKQPAKVAGAVAPPI